MAAPLATPSPAAPPTPAVAPPAAPSAAAPPRVASTELEVEERWLGVTAALVMASYTGVLSRIGLTRLNTLQLDATGQSYVFSSMYAEVVGCIIMGAILPHRSALQAWCARGRRQRPCSHVAPLSLAHTRGVLNSHPGTL